MPTRLVQLQQRVLLNLPLHSSPNEEFAMGRKRITRDDCFVKELVEAALGEGPLWCHECGKQIDPSDAGYWRVYDQNDPAWKTRGVGMADEFYACCEEHADALVARKWAAPRPAEKYSDDTYS
jgi:hypothetical protein